MVSILALIVVAFSAPAYAHEQDRIASQFAAALQSGTLRAFTPLASSATALSSEEWRNVRDFVEEWAPAEVRVVALCGSPELNSSQLCIQLQGSARRRAAGSVLSPFASRWWLTVSSRGVIVAAKSQAAHELDALLRAKAEDRNNLVRDVASSLPDLAEELRRRPLPLSNHAALEDLAQRILLQARQTSDIRAEGDAVITLSHLARAHDDWINAQTITRSWLTKNSDAPPATLASVELESAASAGPDETAEFARSIRKVREIVATTPDAQVERDALALAAIYSIDTLQLDEALRFISALKERASELGWPGALARARLLQGLVYRVMHNDQAATQEFIAAERLGDEAARSDLHAEAMLWHARSALRTGSTNAELLTLLRHAYALAPIDAVDLRADILGSIALIEVEVNNLAAAETTAIELQRLLSLAETMDPRRNGWYAMASVLRAGGHYYEAVNAATESLRAGQRWSLWVAYHTKWLLARDLRKLGRNDEAMENLRESIELIEARRSLVPLTPIDSVHYFTDKAGSYWELADLLIDMKRPTEALAVIERARSGTLRDLESGAHSPTPLTQIENERRNALERSISTLNIRVVGARNDEERRTIRRQLVAARVEREKFESELVAQHPEVLAPRQGAPLFKGTGRFPSAGMVVLQYAVGDQRTNLFVVTRTGGAPTIRAFHIAVGRRELANAVSRLSTKVRERDFSYHDDAEALYSLLLTPAKELMAGRRTLYVVPDDALWRLPFSVLQKKGEQPLVCNHILSYAPSITLLERTTNRLPARRHLRSVITFANPSASLPDAEREAKEIAALYSRRDVLSGKDASEHNAKLLMPGHDVVHFATHGDLDADSPLYSALLLAKDKPEDDGRLEAREVASLHIDARLVVLSACDLGEGRVYPGEGMVGMAWAFLMSGSPATVVSQWQADSRATALLMVAFHKRLLAGDPPAAALQKAALQLRSNPDYAHPFYWAAFRLIGAGS
jgi:CHAT domain-containing protein